MISVLLFAPSHPTRMGTFARCAPARSSGATPPAAGASPGAVSSTPDDGGRPSVVSMAGTGLEQLANRTRHRDTGDVLARHRRGFRLFWTWKSRRRAGQSTEPSDVRALI